MVRRTPIQRRIEDLVSIRGYEPISHAEHGNANADLDLQTDLQGQLTRMDLHDRKIGIYHFIKKPLNDYELYQLKYTSRRLRKDYLEPILEDCETDVLV